MSINNRVNHPTTITNGSDPPQANTTPRAGLTCFIHWKISMPIPATVPRDSRKHSVPTMTAIGVGLRLIFPC